METRQKDFIIIKNKYLILVLIIEICVTLIVCNNFKNILQSKFIFANKIIQKIIN